MMVSAIVLAGGRSTRFGRDKLAEPIDGIPLLWRTIDAVRAVADDIVVVTLPDASAALPAGVREVHDAIADSGPLVGVLAGLAAARHDTAIIVGGDMPWVHPEVIGLMLAGLAGPPVATAVALGSDGRRQQLPIAVAREAALAAGLALVDAGERRLGSLLEALDATTLEESRWRALDPDAATLRDVDVPEDLPAQG